MELHTANEIVPLIAMVFYKQLTEEIKKIAGNSYKEISQCFAVAMFTTSLLNER